MRRCVLLVPAAALLVLSLSACSPVTAGAAATVGDTRITVNELAERTDRVFELPGAKEQLQRADVQRRILTELVGLQVDERLAARNGVAITQQQVDQLLQRGISQTGGAQQLQLQLLTGQQPVPAFAGADVYFRDALLLDGLLTKLAPAEVPEAALRDFYAQQEGTFRNAKTAHIVVADRATADTVVAAAKAKPDSFPALVTQYSTDAATKQTGGDQGVQPRGTFTAAVEDAIYAARPGDIVGPIESNGAFEVIKVESVTNRSFEQVRDQLARAAREPQSPYTQMLLTQARTEEAARLRVQTNPRFGTVATDGGSGGFAVSVSPDLLSVPAGGGSGPATFAPGAQGGQGGQGSPVGPGPANPGAPGGP